MENKDVNQNKNFGSGFEKKHRSTSGNVMGGILLLIVGGIWLAAKLNTIFLPSWVLSWQMFLIVLGLFLGFKHSFQKSSWVVLVLIGLIFLIDDFFLFNVKLYFWPLLIIGIGLWLILRPKKQYPRQFGSIDYQAAEKTENREQSTYAGLYSDDEVIDSTTVFGGIKKNIISKSFKGGEVVSVFGGTELNMMQADIQHPIVMEATQIFGGTSLIIPPHWQVKSDIVAILGGVEDKRPVMAQGYDPNKVLILKGVALFGGLTIKSY